MSHPLKTEIELFVCVCVSVHWCYMKVFTSTQTNNPPVFIMFLFLVINCITACLKLAGEKQTQLWWGTKSLIAIYPCEGSRYSFLTVILAALMPCKAALLSWSSYYGIIPSEAAADKKKSTVQEISPLQNENTNIEFDLKPEKNFYATFIIMFCTLLWQARISALTDMERSGKEVFLLMSHTFAFSCGL